MQIESNIPVTKMTRNGKHDETVNAMQIGDSVPFPAVEGITVEDDNAKKEASSLANALRAAGFKAVTRPEGFGFRVWKQERSEKPEAAAPLNDGSELPPPVTGPRAPGTNGPDDPGEEEPAAS